MSISTLSTAVLRRIIELQEQKASLAARIAAVDSEMARLASGTPARSPGRPAKAGKRAKTATKATQPLKAAKPGPKRGKPGRRGVIGERVLAALKAVGPEGIRVADLARRLAMKPQNLHVWFNTTGRKGGRIERVTKGTYRLKA